MAKVRCWTEEMILLGTMDDSHFSYRLQKGYILLTMFHCCDQDTLWVAEQLVKCLPVLSKLRTRTVTLLCFSSTTLPLMSSPSHARTHAHTHTKITLSIFKQDKRFHRQQVDSGKGESLPGDCATTKVLVLSPSLSCMKQHVQHLVPFSGILVH